jgi:erythromycin esterase
MKLLSIAGCLLLGAPAFAQDVRSYVAANTVPIATLDATSDDYADLAAVGQAIGDARVVMLGEQDHGDGPTFQAKTRLIKYLHERKGFTVLAFESDFYGLTAGWDQLAKQPDSIRHFLRQNIYSLWTNSADCRYLFQHYIPNSFQTSSPLQVTGFDSQLYATYSRTHLKQNLDSYLVSQGVNRKFPSPAAYQTFLEAVQGLLDKQATPEAYRSAMRKPLDDGLQLISQALLAARDTSAWPRVIASLQAYIVRSYPLLARDKAMADNLKFLVTRQHPGAKVIVWAANAHTMRYTDQQPGKGRAFDLVIRHKMGAYFVQDPQWARQTYVLGFASYQGTAGRLGTAPYPVALPEKDGLETWIPAQIAYGFLDFTAYNKQFNSPTTPFSMKSPGHDLPPAHISPVAWNLAYDGLFFIRDMKATTKIE